MATHKVRDVAAPQGDREVKGAGAYGVCFGGLTGDGDVQLCASASKARSVVQESFREMLGPTGVMVKNRYLDSGMADQLLSAVDAQLSDWSDLTAGSYLDVVAEIPNFTTLRIGVFRADYVWDGYKNVYQIPFAVRVPRSTKRELKITKEIK